MLSYAVLLTRSPHAITPEVVDGLRAVGFDDTGILDICQVVSYYNYVNRLADGLGVELESTWTEDDMTMTPAAFRIRLTQRHGPGS